MKKNLPHISYKVHLFFFIIIIFAIIHFYKNKESVRKDYESFLHNHEYTKHLGISPDELKQIPKQDRPDLAWEQNFLMTMDPNLGYPPVERLIPVYNQVKQLKKLKAGVFPAMA